MKKFSLAALCYCLLIAGNALAETAQCPQITNGEEIKNFLAEAKKAELTPGKDVRRVFDYAGHKWFMPPEEWNDLTKEPTSKSVRVTKITFDKSEEEGKKVRCFYTQIKTTPYNPDIVVTKKFRMTTLN